MFVPLNISAMYIYSILNVYLNVEKKTCALSAVANWYLNKAFFNVFLKNLCIFKSEYIHDNTTLRRFLYN